ncbi:sigma factor-like helix-turn-helix DNA-binding protein [Rugosimonospora africana]|uniref:RNA polymerase sigma-70 region 4 domain-containing protein n=1 Tax=Rugosimonospora africana TaxID=556532 RepID=A0A8J3R2P0_9ACTN|nr:sigma factor-like helix-turn-helix DNA-binding protein [Rugosimonospora africana]GIH20684.1 hypothetical protein Raf01_88560 [Rugosimonospora africana]
MTEQPDDLPPDAYHDTAWPQILPWLAHHAPDTTPELAVAAPSPDWWLTESPAVTTMAVDHDDLCRRLARLFITRHPDTTFDDAFPTLPVRLPLAALRAGARARTAFQRLQLHTLGDVVKLRVHDLYAVRGTGQGTIEDITTTLVSAAITRPAALGATAYDNDPDTTTPSPAETLPPAQAQLLEDLEQLAAWRHIRRNAEQPLFNLAVEDGAPEQIQDLVTRINSLTAADIAPQPTPPDPILELTALLSRLDERQSLVLRERMIATDPRRLAELGARLDISRERVRQIESGIKEQLTGALHFGTATGNLLASLHVEIQPIARLDRLIDLHPELARDVPGFDAPLWLILDRLDDYFEVTDGWAAAPDVSSAADRTRTLLEDFADGHGLVDLTAVAAATTMPVTELRAWLQHCGHLLHGDTVLTRTRSMADHAAGLLAIAGQPLHIDDLHQRLGRDRALRSLANTLADDDRFIRTDRSTWALAEWQVEQYTSIRQLIGRELDATDGRVGINELVQSIAGRFNISPSSVYTNASSGEYEIVDGIVQRRTDPTPARKEPAATRRLFRDGELWRLRISVTRDHLRGSGFPIPAGVANLVGCRRGDVVELDSDLGTQNIRWTAAQPSSGTIKRFLDGLDSREGQTLFLEFLPDSRFNVRPADDIPENTPPLTQALRLTGSAPTDDPDTARARLAHAVGLPDDTKPRRILSAYQQRGDDDIAGLLEQVWTRPSTPAPGTPDTGPTAGTTITADPSRPDQTTS